MKTGFVRGLWGIFDNSHRIKARRFRVENNIKATVKNKFSPPCKTYVFGKENAETLKSNGVENIELLDENPFQFDLVAHQYRHKLEILKHAMTEFDEIVYLDWDCYATRHIPVDFWIALREKDVFQANLMQYHRIKCPWRETDPRKVPNGGFIYTRDKSLPQKAIDYWNTIPQDNDEPAWAKVVEELMGGKWNGIDEYWTRFEPKWCNLHKASPYAAEQLKGKEACFIHYQGKGS